MTQSRPHWPQKRQSQDFFNSDCSTSDLTKKSRNVAIWCQSDPRLPWSIGPQVNCGEEMQRHMSYSGQTLEHLQDMFCANMLAESRDFAHKGFPAWSQDLFMEQGLGFTTFDILCFVFLCDRKMGVKRYISLSV